MSNAPTDNTCSDTTVITLNTKNQREKGGKNGLESNGRRKKMKRGAGVLHWEEMMVVWGKKEAAVEKLFHLEMKGAVGEGVISKGNIITFSYLLLECCGEGQGRRGSTEKHLKVITIPKVHLCDDSSSFLPFVYLLEVGGA